MPFQHQIGSAFATGKGQSGFKLPFYRLAQNLGGQRNAVCGDAANVDGHRQIRQGKCAGLGSRRGLGYGQTAQNNLGGGKLVYRDIACQECRAVPVEHHIAQDKPDALVIGNGHLGQAGLRRKRALKSGDNHLPTGTREVVLKKGGQIIAVALLGERRQRGKAKGKAQGGGGAAQHQKACPSPM